MPPKKKRGTKKPRKKPDTKSRETLSDEIADQAAVNAGLEGDEEEVPSSPSPFDNPALRPELGVEFGTAAPTASPSSSTKKPSAGADLFALVERKLRGRVKIRGDGSKAKMRVASHLAAEAYVEQLILGRYKFIRDFLDRSLGKPTQRLEVGKGAVEELRQWLMDPGPTETGLSGELEELERLAGGLRSQRGKELAARLELLRKAAAAR